LYKQLANNEQLPDNLIKIHDLGDIISQEFEIVKNSTSNEDQSEDKEN
ncbi:18037_t:CDS:1, partial [Racocetra fulgida]